MENVEIAYYETARDVPQQFDYELTDSDRLCFKCPLVECRPMTKKCPIAIYKEAEKSQKKILEFYASLVKNGADVGDVLKEMFS